MRCVPGGCSSDAPAACRVGMGVTGGTPFGFDVGQAPGAAGGTMAGIDLGVRGMRVGGIRKLKVPPNLAYGNKQVGPLSKHNHTQHVLYRCMSLCDVHWQASMALWSGAACCGLMACVVQHISRLRSCCARLASRSGLALPAA